METSTSDFLKAVAGVIGDRIASVKHYIIVAFTIIILVVIGYYLSFNYRTNKKLTDIINTHKSNIQFQTDYCNPNYKKYNLCDFHIKGSHNTALTGFKKYDYISLDMIYQVLKLGTRYLEFEIFAKEQNLEAVPVVSVGSKSGDWKMTANVLDCKEVFNLLATHAFSQKLLQNFKDPLFIFLDIKTDNVKVLDKLADIIETSFKINLLDKRYNFQRKNIAETKVCDLLEKIVIMSSKGYLNTELERLINISTESPYLERLTYSDLIIQKKFNVNQPDFAISSNKISFHKGISNDYIQIHDYSINLQEMNIFRDMKIKIGNSRFPQNRTREHLLTIDNITSNKISFKKHDSISFKREDKGNTIVVQGYTVNEKAKEIDEVNKYRLTIVIPDYDLFSGNFNPKNIWYTGTQFVAMNFQTLDDNMKIYLKFFQKRALKLKQSSLLKVVKDVPKDTSYPTNKVKKDLERKFKSDCEEIPPSIPSPTTSVGPLSEEELKKRLKDYNPEIEKDQVYNINYDFLKKNLSLDIFFEPIFNPALRLIKDSNKLRMSLGYQKGNFLFQVLSSNNNKLLNSVRIFIDNSYLSVNSNRQLTFIDVDSAEAKQNDFLDKTTFLLLEPANGKPESCSLAHVINEDIGNNQTTPVLNYLKIRNYFSTNNRIYKYNQTKYKKILTLTGGEFTKGGVTDNIPTYTIWRPFKYKEFEPIGDVIFEGEQIPTTDDLLDSSYIVAGATKHPVGFEMVHKFEPKVKKTDPMENTPAFVIWKPIAPDGFISMGYVTVKDGGDTPPSKKSVVCVAANFVKPAEVITGGEFTRFKKTYYNRTVSFWTGQNLNYFVPTDTKVEVDLGNLKVTPPFEFENPIYDFVDFSDFTDDLVYLDNDISNLSAREAATFKYTVSYKSGEFTEYQLYNGLNEIPDQDGKIIAYTRNRNNGQLCVSLPYSYWSSHFKEISEEFSEDGNDAAAGNFNYLTRYDKCPEDNKIMGATVYATESNCFKMGGYMTNSQKFRASVADDRTGKCYLDLCNTKTDDSLFLNKKGGCNDANKLVDAKIKVPYEDCMSMGGEYLGPSQNPDKLVKCGVDVCKRPGRFTYKLPAGNQTKGSKEEIARYKMDVIQSERGLRRKCNSIHSDAIYDGSICDMPMFYNSSSDSSELNVSSCRDKNYFGTSFKYLDDNTIRLRDNSDYCMTVELDNKGDAITKRKENPDDPGKDNKLTLTSCKSTRLGQQFNMDNNNNIRYISNKNGTTDLCVTNEYDNSLRLKKCNQILPSQKWVFKNMPNDFCIGKGSIVYYFKKEPRVPKTYNSENTFNLPVENLLQEEYDYNNIHMYIRARVTGITETVIKIEDLKYKDKYIVPIKKASEMDNLVLEYKPPLDKLVLGTKIIGKNGGFSKIDNANTITYTEDNVKWYGVITEKLNNGNYKVFFSINSIEPNQKNQKCGRPDYSMVKELTIDEFYLLKNASIC